MNLGVWCVGKPLVASLFFFGGGGGEGGAVEEIQTYCSRDSLIIIFKRGINLYDLCECVVLHIDGIVSYIN